MITTQLSADSLDAAIGLPSPTEPVTSHFSFTPDLPIDLTDARNRIRLVFAQHKHIATATGKMRIEVDDNARQKAKETIRDFFAASDYPIEPAITLWDNSRRQLYRVEFTKAASGEIADMPKPFRLPLVSGLGRRVVGRLLAEFLPKLP